jgi:hypothetical protein
MSVTPVWRVFLRYSSLSRSQENQREKLRKLAAPQNHEAFRDSPTTKTNGVFRGIAHAPTGEALYIQCSPCRLGNCTPVFCVKQQQASGQVEWDMCRGKSQASRSACPIFFAHNLISKEPGLQPGLAPLFRVSFDAFQRS